MEEIIKPNKNMETNSHNSPKYAFLYMLSLAALMFVGFSVGMIAFQIINKYVPDAINQFRSSFDTSALRFALSALLVAAPVFFIVNYFIYKGLYKGALTKDSGVRKWLTYFILLVSSVVILGWFIGLINTFLGGELTLKFALKALISIILSALAFNFYLYDIRRESMTGKKDNVVRIYFYIALVIVIGALSSALIFGESPMEARDKKLDSAILDDFSSIENAVIRYYNSNESLPENLSVLEEEIEFVTQNIVTDPETDSGYQYNILGEKKYELCADFRTSNLENDDRISEFYRETWPHEKGRQCIEKSVEDLERKLMPTPIR